ncbi:MAG TPA: DUF4331 domain-containing protein [Myxococcales bacterium]
MKTYRVVAVALLLSGPALASSHREAPAIANDPAADNTDVYAFVTSKNGANDTLNIVANWIPFEEPASGPNFFKFSDDVLYQIHVTRGPSSLADVVTYTFRFTSQVPPTKDPAAVCPTPGTAACVGGGKEFFSQLTGNIPTSGGAIIQTYTVTKTTSTSASVIVSGAIAAPWRIGPRTQATLHALAPALVTSATYDDAYAATFIKTATDNATRVFAGPRDDGFYVDLGGVFDLANLRPKGTAQDGLAGYNVHSIALEIPTTQLTADGAAPGTTASDANTLGIWASSSRQKVTIQRSNGKVSGYGPFVQVSRLGLPLINEAVIGYQDKDKYNRTQPKDDVANFGAYFLNPVIVPDAEAVGIYSALGITVDDTFRHNRTDILDVINLKASGHNITAVGDVLRIDLNLPTQFPNGRSIPGGTGTNAAAKEQVDVTDVELSLLLGKPAALTAGPGGTPLIQDGVDYNDKPFLTQFPWLALPWEGFSEGHGKPTP